MMDDTDNHQKWQNVNAGDSFTMGDPDYSSGEIVQNSPTSPDAAPGSSCDLVNLPTAQDFEFIKPISKGAFGKVWLGYKKDKPDTIYAIKVMKKEDLIRKNLIAQVTAERDAQARSRSPYVVQLFYSIQTRQNILLVMEYMIGGDVKSLLIMYGFFPEEMACMYAAEVTLALKYLHKRGIVHRDLKPDNMLISETGHIKLTDFGLSKVTMDYTAHSAGSFTPYPAKGGGRHFDLRTPGQVRSLSSSLAFSTFSSHKKSEEIMSCTIATEPETSSNDMKDVLQTSAEQGDSSHDITDQEDGKSLTPPHKDGSGILPQQPRTPLEKGQKQILAKRLLTPSTTLPLQLSRLASSNLVMTPPVKSLTPTLQDSLTWRTSSASDSKSRVACSLLQYSLLSRSAARQSGSFPGTGRGDAEKSADESLDSDRGVSLQSRPSSGLSSEDSKDISESSLRSSVFSSDLEHSIHRCNGKSRCGNSCDASAELQLSCDSHIMPIYRVEGEEDSTPLLHRKHDSVLTSFSAQNLRSMTKGSYSDTSWNLDIDRSGEKKASTDVRRLGGLEEERHTPELDRPSSNDKHIHTGHKPHPQRDTNNEQDTEVFQNNFQNINQESLMDENQESGKISFMPSELHHQSRNLSSNSQEKARGVLSALDESLGEIHQLRPQSIAGSTDLDLSSDFSTHLQRDRNLNSTRLSMDFGPSKISLDFGPELKDLSHVSGLSRLPLHPLVPKLNTHRGERVETGAAASGGSFTSHVEPEHPAVLLRKKPTGLKRTVTDHMEAPGSGGQLFRRRLSKPGLRRVLSETFDQCLLSGSESARMDGKSSKNLLHNKSRSQEIQNSPGTHGFIERELKEEDAEAVSSRSAFQRKRSCQEALMETSQDLPEPKMPCKLNLPNPNHTGLTPDLRRLAMRNNVHNNHQLPGGLISDLFRAGARGMPESTDMSNSVHGGVAFKQSALTDSDNEVSSPGKHSGPTNAMDAQHIGDNLTSLSIENSGRFPRMGQEEQSFGAGKDNSGKENIEKCHSTQQMDQSGFNLHRVPACTNLTLHCVPALSPSAVANSQLSPLSTDVTVPCHSSDSPKEKHVKFYMESPSPRPARHSSPAPGSDGSRLQPPPLIIKKGVSTNDSLGQDGSFLNMSIEFEMPEGRIGALGSPKQPASSFPSSNNEIYNNAETPSPHRSPRLLEIPTPAGKNRGTRARSLSSNASILSDIGHDEDDVRMLSPQAVPVNAEHLLHSPPLTFSGKAPQLTSNSGVLTSAQTRDCAEPMNISDNGSRPKGTEDCAADNGCHGNNAEQGFSSTFDPSRDHPMRSTEKERWGHEVADNSTVFPRPVSVVSSEENNSGPPLSQTPKPAANPKREDALLVFKTPRCTPVTATGRSLYPGLHTQPQTPATRTTSHAGASVWPMGTPMRTPKSVRRGREPPPTKIEEERILGTPDYLAPEILLRQQHGFAVDWWALGVCLYEFLTGLPPFNDETPDAVFANILNRDIAWPEDEEALSEEAQAAVEALLTFDPKRRPAAQETMNLPFFSDIDWNNLLEVEPLFVPQPDDNMDTTYFKPKNDQRNLVMSAVDL